jgi:hypothetical protein
VGTSILLLRRAAEALGGRRAGHVAVVLALGSPFAAYYCQAVAAEVPAFVGVCLALYGFARWRGAEDDTGVRRFRHEAMVWIGLSLFVLSRPNGVLLLGLSGLVGLWLWFRGAAPDRPLALMSLRTTVVVVTMLATFLGVASVLGGRGGELRQGGYLTYVVFQGRFQYRSEPWDWRYWANESRADSEDYQAWLRESGALITRARQSGVPLDDLQRRWILDDWLSNPGINARAAAIRSLTLHLYRVNSAEPEDFRVGALPGWLVFMAFHLAVNLPRAPTGSPGPILGAVGSLARAPGVSRAHVCRAQVPLSLPAGPGRHDRPGPGAGAGRAVAGRGRLRRSRTRRRNRLRGARVEP